MSTMRPRLRTVLAYVFVLLLPALFITTSVRLAFTALPLYTYGFERYGAAERTRISPADLEQVGREFIAFFNGDDPTLRIRARVSGVERPLFSEREVAHMRDVHDLVRGFFRWQTAMMVALGVYVVGGLALAGGRFARELGWALFWGGALTLALFAVFAALVTVAFSQLFLLFHLLSFSNDFWTLDPARDYLIMLFPAGFWFDSALALGVMIAVQAAVAIGAGVALTRAQRARLRRLKAA
ncbi:MAG: TIGR01906 family membrane protein [Dehalococcoidia bacterium]|nr:TIGR01906 family membrane protein [Dehalococcoidia bacterium]